KQGCALRIAGRKGQAARRGEYISRNAGRSPWVDRAYTKQEFVPGRRPWDRPEELIMETESKSRDDYTNPRLPPATPPAVDPAARADDAVGLAMDNGDSEHDGSVVSSVGREKED